MRLEREGHRILKLNIGNPAPFGFEGPPEILEDMIANLPVRTATSTPRACSSAREAIVQHYQQPGIEASTSRTSTSATACPS